MTTATEEMTARISGIESVLIQGDLRALSSEQRTAYYLRVCESLSLNPLTRPFEYLTFQGRLILYARRDATEQLRRRDGVSVTIVNRRLEGGIYTVSARARTPEGREDESDGVVNVEGLKGDALANAYMRAETKAKRRVTLSLCGLGMLDETEVGEAPLPSLPVAPVAPVAPVTPVAEAETEAETEAEPAAELVEMKPSTITSAELARDLEYHRARLRLRWEDMTARINHRYDTGYHRQTRFREIPREQIEWLLSELAKQPDVLRK